MNSLTKVLVLSVVLIVSAVVFYLKGAFLFEKLNRDTPKARFFTLGSVPLFFAGVILLIGGTGWISGHNGDVRDESTKRAFAIGKEALDLAPSNSRGGSEDYLEG